MKIKINKFRQGYSLVGTGRIIGLPYTFKFDWDCTTFNIPSRCLNKVFWERSFFYGIKLQ
jgi:hypothetical protein